jgi:hypothetical protein
VNHAALARFRRVAVEAFDLALALPDVPDRLRELADWVDTMPSCLRSDVTKAPEMGGGSAKREAVSKSVPEMKPASDFETESGKGNQGPSLRFSPPRPAVEKEEAFTEDELPTGEVERAKAAAGRADAPRLNAHGDRRGMAGGRKARDFTGLKLGTFVGVERVGSDRNGSPLWFFRCAGCNETKTWSAARIAQGLHGHKPPPGKGHECPKAPAIDAPKPAPEPAANLDGEESGPVSLTAEEAELVRTGAAVKMLSDGTIEARPAVPLATAEELAAPPRNPRLSGFSTLVGQRFGTWKVVDRAGGALGMTYWKCACTKCGASKEVAALGAHGLRVRPPACPSCRLRGGKSEAPEEGEEAAE